MAIIMESVVFLHSSTALSVSYSVAIWNLFEKQEKTDSSAGFIIPNNHVVVDKTISQVAESIKVE